MNLNKRQQLLAILAIVAVGFFVADKLVITPLTNSWKARTVRLAKLKDDVREVRTGFECGVALKGFNDFAVGDILECVVTEKG